MSFFAGRAPFTGNLVGMGDPGFSLHKAFNLISVSMLHSHHCSLFNVQLQHMFTLTLSQFSQRGFVSARIIASLKPPQALVAACTVCDLAIFTPVFYHRAFPYRSLK